MHTGASPSEISPSLCPSGARESFLRADFDTCIAMLRGRRSADRDFLLARAYLRMKRPADAEGVLRTSRGRERSTWALLLGVALARQNKDDEAQPLFSRAFAVAQTDDERGEARYQEALLHWMRERTDEAAVILSEGDFGSNSGLAEELRGWIAVRRAEYALAARAFEHAALLANGDVLLECNALSAASVIAREMHIPAIMTRVLHRVSRIEWTPYLQIQRFHITRAAAWFAAIEGEYAYALRRLRTAAKFAIGEAWQVGAMCDRAYLSLVLGEEFNGWALADEALDTANEIDWESTVGEERMGLLYLANILALRRPIDAQRCWRRYNGLPAPDPLIVWHSPNIEAWEAFTAGSLEKGVGNSVAAATHFNRAFSIYRRIGYEWRAVLTLLARGWSGSSERGYSDYVETTLRRFPNSWLRQLVERELHRQRSAIADNTIQLPVAN